MKRQIESELVLETGDIDAQGAEVKEILLHQLNQTVYSFRFITIFIYTIFEE